MVKSTLLVDNTEATLNVALAELLQQRELQAIGEAIIHKKSKGVGKKPDILLTVNGVKIIIEGKFEIQSAEAILEKQCIERIEDGLCEICIGIIYHNWISTSLNPTMKAVKEQLLKTKFRTIIMSVAPIETAQLTFDNLSTGLPLGLKKTGWQEIDLDQLSNLVRSSYTAVVSEDLLGKAVESFASALQEAALKLIASGSPDALASKISEIMEIPEAADDEPEEG